jgi:hypothetical protein
MGIYLFKWSAKSKPASRFGWLFDPLVEPTPRWVVAAEIVLLVVIALAFIGLVIWLSQGLPGGVAH